MRAVATGAKLRQHPRGVIETGTRDLDVVLADLFARGIRHLYVEGGPTVASAFVAAGLVDEYLIFLAPTVIGGDRLALGEHDPLGERLGQVRVDRASDPDVRTEGGPVLSGAQQDPDGDVDAVVALGDDEGRRAVARAARVGRDEATPVRVGPESLDPGPVARPDGGWAGDDRVPGRRAAGLENDSKNSVLNHCLAKCPGVRAEERAGVGRILPKIGALKRPRRWGGAGRRTGPPRRRAGPQAQACCSSVISSGASAARPRASRLLTVPAGTPSSAAIWSTDSPSR